MNQHDRFNPRIRRSVLTAAPEFLHYRTSYRVLVPPRSGKGRVRAALLLLTLVAMAVCPLTLCAAPSVDPLSIDRSVLGRMIHRDGIKAESHGGPVERPLAERSAAAGQTVASTYEHSGANGIVDSRTRVTSTYDQRRNLVRYVVERDSEADGVYETQTYETSRYSQGGFVVELVSETHTSDVSQDRRVTLSTTEYDLHGNPLKQLEETRNSAGVLLSSSIHSLAYDRFENLVQHTRTWSDYRASVTYVRDHQGHPTTVVTEDDVGNDGSINWLRVEVLEYDQHGWPIGRRIDYGSSPDGILMVIDARLTQRDEYNRFGSFVARQLEFDFEADGVIERRSVTSTLSFDDRRNPVVFLTEEYHFDRDVPNGLYERSVARDTYNGQRQIVEELLDIDHYPLGSIDERYRATHEYNGASRVHGTVEAAKADRLEAAVVRLRVVSGNPFRDRIELGYHILSSGPVELGIYDVRGRLVRSLIQEPAAAGEGRVIWDGKEASGAPTSAGIYFARLRAAGSETSIRLMRLR